MELRDFCQTTVAHVTPEKSVLEATWAMRENHVGDLVVVEQADDGRRIPIGMLTDRDIVINLIAEGARDLKAERVGEVMSEEIIVAKHDDTAEDALATMEANGIRRLPVVADDGDLFGIVTLDDMLSYIANRMAALSNVVGTEIRHEMEKDRP